MSSIRNLLGLLTLTIATSAFSADKLENIPLVWKPTTAIANVSAVNLNDAENLKIELVSIIDGRTGEKELIGENREKPQIKRVSTKDDVVTFIKNNMKEQIEKSGLNTVDQGGNISIDAEVKSFFVTETDTYNGEVTMKVTLKNKEGKVIWTGMVNGSSSHFGRSYKAENYYETLSDAIIQATYNLIAGPVFHTAITKS